MVAGDTLSTHDDTSELSHALALRDEAELEAVTRARTELSSVDPCDVPATFLDVTSLGAGLKASGWSQGRAVQILADAAGDSNAAYSERFRAIEMLDERIERALRYSGVLATATIRQTTRDEHGSMTTAELTAVTTTQAHLARVSELQAGLNQKRVVDARDVTPREATTPANVAAPTPSHSPREETNEQQ